MSKEKPCKYIDIKIKEAYTKTFKAKSYEQGLILILNAHYDANWEEDDIEALDGDEVETLVAHLMNHLQLMNGNITDHEFKVRQELGDKLYYNTPDAFVNNHDDKKYNTLVKFKTDYESCDTQFGILHDDILICLCGCGNIYEYGTYTILSKIEKTNASALLLNHFDNDNAAKDDKFTIELSYSELETLNGHLAEHLASNVPLGSLNNACSKDLQAVLDKLSAHMC